MSIIISASSWLILSVFIGVFANFKGRSLALWFILSLLISPLLAGIFLFFSSDENKNLAEAKKKHIEENTIKFSSIEESIKNIQYLSIKNNLNENEIFEKKQRYFLSLSKKFIFETPDNFQAKILMLVDQGYLSTQDIHSIAENITLLN